MLRDSPNFVGHLKIVTLIPAGPDFSFLTNEKNSHAAQTQNTNACKNRSENT